MYNMNEAQVHYGRWKKSEKKKETHTIWLHFYDIVQNAGMHWKQVT